MPRQYFFWKYFNTIIVLYCILVQKSPIFVQLSPIQCTYSNIFIRFFKFSPANTNIYQNSYRVIGVLCGLRQGVLSSQCGYLISFGTKFFMSLREVAHYGAPAGYCVPVGKRNKQAKDKQLTITAIVWSKAQFMTRNALYVILRSCIATTWESPGREPYYKTPRKILYVTLKEN